MSNPYPPYPESDYPPDDDVEEVDAVEADYPQFLDSPLKEKPEYQESDDTEAEDEVEESPNRVIYRGSTNDPAFGFLLALAMCIGLIPLINNGNADLRYTIAWGVLAGVGVLSWLLGSLERIEQEVPENLGWGIGFGILVGAPFLLFGGSILQTAVRDIFPDYSAGTVLAYLVFVMPLAETLFFRGLLQQQSQSSPMETPAVFPCYVGESTGVSIGGDCDCCCTGDDECAVCLCA